MFGVLLKMFGPMALRAVVVAASGFLAAKGLDGDQTNTVIAAAGIGLTLAQSAFEKVRAKQKQLVAQSSPKKMTETEVDKKIKSGDMIPSVMTPKDVVPVPAP